MYNRIWIPGLELGSGHIDNEDLTGAVIAITGITPKSSPQPASGHREKRDTETLLAWAWNGSPSSEEMAVLLP